MTWAKWCGWKWWWWWWYWWRWWWWWWWWYWWWSLMREEVEKVNEGYTHGLMGLYVHLWECHQTSCDQIYAKTKIIIKSNIKEFEMTVQKFVELSISSIFFVLGRRFFYENFPQLKFKNPHVEFSGSQEKSQPAELLIKFGMLKWYFNWEMKFSFYSYCPQVIIIIERWLL